MSAYGDLKRKIKKPSERKSIKYWDQLMKLAKAYDQTDQLYDQTRKTLEDAKQKLNRELGGESHWAKKEKDRIGSLARQHETVKQQRHDEWKEIQVLKKKLVQAGVLEYD